MSQPVLEALQSAVVPVAVRTEESPLDSVEGRKTISFLRLMVDPEDSLALYSLLALGQGVGEETLRSVRQLAKNKGCKFCQALLDIKKNPHLTSSGKLLATLQDIQEYLESSINHIQKPLSEQIDMVINRVTQNPETQRTIQDYFSQLVRESGEDSLSGLLGAISSSLNKAEQELVDGAVNIMTMHRAKGLSADAVFILGAEKQFIPGRNIGQKAEDERRLLYVSLTRARHHLYITYCSRRIRNQAYCGSESGNPRRDLCPFLADSPVKPMTV